MKPLGFTVEQMRELLAARDQLTHKNARTRRGAEEQIANFARDATERCDKLRDQLCRAEQFARQLAAPTRAGPP